FRSGARFPKHFAGWPDGKLETNRIFDVLSNQYRSIDSLEGNVLVASDLHHPRAHCLVRHRKWPWPAGQRVLAGRRQKLQHHFLSHAEPRVVVASTPNDMRHDPPGFRAVRMFRRPATGLAKNIVPNREKTKSYSGSKWSSSASPFTKEIFYSPN